MTAGPGRRDRRREFDPKGKSALFSGASRNDGPFTIECSGCGGLSRVGLVGLLKLAFPVNFTVPLRYHHTWMRCPACGERRWVSIKRLH